MKFKQTLLAASIAASLSACSNPVSNGSGIDQGSQTAQESSFSWVKKIVRGWTAKASLSVPAQGLITDALLDPKFMGASFSGSRVRTFAPYAEGDFVSIFTSKDSNWALGSSKVENQRLSYLWPVAVVASPYRGWEINPMSGFGEAAATPQQKQIYLGVQEASIEYTNSLLTEIASKLNEDIGVAEDPAQAKAAIQQIFESIPKDSLKRIWDEAISNASGRQRTIDLSGAKGVDWSTNDGNSYSGVADGLHWQKAGIEWFGKGALSGKQWSIGLESSISRGQEKSSGGSQNSSSSTGEKTTGTAQPK